MSPSRLHAKNLVASRKARFEILEDRRLLSICEPTIQLFDASPALFVENRGQWQDTSVRYAFQGSRANVLLTDSGPVFQLFKREASEGATEASFPHDPFDLGTELGDQADVATQYTEFSVHFDGGNVVRPVGLNGAETVYNYYLGDEANWRTDVPSYESVRYQGLYHGIDLLTWGRGDSLKYEFHVAPGADYGQIEVSYAGIDGLWLDTDGALHVQTSLGELVDEAPYIYQEIDGDRVQVAGSFELIDADAYSFAVNGDYDPNVELIIDPDLTWASFLGGSNVYDDGEAVAVDAAGAAFITGKTDASDFPTPGGFDQSYGGHNDAFVAKVTSSGALAWASFLGGNSCDWGEGIAVDASGAALVTGLTQSPDFPTPGGFDQSYNGGYNDAFVAKVTSSGTLAWASFLGGDDDDYGFGIATDGAGAALITGSTRSLDFPTPGGFDQSHNGLSDVFVAKFTSNGGLAWGSFLGGNSDDSGRDIAVDASGAALIIGDTMSSDFPTPDGFDTSYNGGDWLFGDVFVGKVTSTGELAWASFLGGSDGDAGRGIAVDASEAALVTGFTQSPDFPTPGGFDQSYNGGYNDAFVAKVTSSGTLAWASFLGGDDNDDGFGIATDGAGAALITGSTRSLDFPTPGGFDQSHNGLSDVFVAKFTSNGGLPWASFLGGDNYDYGFGIAIDGARAALITGSTRSLDFPTPGGFDQTHNGGVRDAFVAKISNVGSPASQYVVLNWAEECPRKFDVKEIGFGWERFDEVPGTTPVAELWYVDDPEQFKADVLDFLSQRYYGDDAELRTDNIIFTTTPRDNAAVVYFSDYGPKKSDGYELGGKAYTGVDQFNENLSGECIVYINGWTSAEQVGEVVAHEVGHLLGLAHVSPSDESEIMEPEKSPEYQRFNNTRSVLADTHDLKRYLGFRHNPVYHLRRYVGGESHAELRELDIRSGLYDTRALDILAHIISDEIVAETVLYNLHILGGTSECTEVSLGHFDHISLGELSELEFTLDLGSYLFVAGSSEEGGELDTVLSVGNPFEEANRPIHPVDGEITAFWQQRIDDGFGDGFFTLAEAGISGQLVSPCPTEICALSVTSTVTEREAVTLTAEFTDPDMTDEHSATIYWGDGTSSAGVVSESDFSGTVEASRVYEDDGVYNVVVTVTDGEGDFDTDAATVTVTNLAPTVSVDAATTIDEGSLFTGSGSFVDPGADQWTATVDYGDGTGEQPLTLKPDKTFDLSHVYSDKGVYDVTVEAADDDGGVGSATLAVTVDNVAPTLVLDPVVAIDENGMATLAGTLSDPGTLDTFTLTVDWGDDSLVETFDYPAATVTFTQTHQYLDDPSGTPSGGYTITVTVEDDDTGTDTATTMATASVAAIQAWVRDTDTALPADPNGEADTLPESLEWIDEWDSFWIEIWGRTPYNDDYGIGSFSVDLLYNTDLFTATTIEYGPAFTESQSGTIDDAAGRVEDLAAATLRTDVGDDQNVLLARVLFEPQEQDTGVPHNADGDYITPAADLGMQLEAAQVDVALGARVNARLGDAPDTKLWPVMYDIDDDGRVGFGDLAFFATAFQQTVGDPGADFAWACDFDYSGRVDVGDLAFFAENFQCTPGSPMVYPGNFPDDWHSGTQAAAMQAPAAGLQAPDPALVLACCVWDFDTPESVSGNSSDAQEAKVVDFLIAHGYW